MTKASFETRTPGSIVKRSDSVKIFAEKSKLESDSKAKLLCDVECDQNNFQLLRTAAPDNKVISYVNKPESPWIVIKGIKTQDQSPGYKLSIGDVIKLGRVKLKISDIKKDAVLEESLENNTKNFATKLNDPNDKSKEEGHKEDAFSVGKKKRSYICRICYCDEKEMESPLIQPCSCSGTMRYIHLICLQKWLKSKVVSKTSTSENSIIYTLKQIECELCKTLLPGKYITLKYLLNFSSINYKINCYLIN